MKTLENVKVLGVRTSNRLGVDSQTKQEFTCSINEISKFSNTKSSSRARALYVGRLILSKKPISLDTL